MKTICLLMLLPLTGQAVTLTQSQTPNMPIPDNSPVGVSSIINFDTITTTTVTSVEVKLDLSGVPTAGWSGDIYAYLIHGGGFSVLLNRPGRTSTNSFGYGNNSLLVTLTDGASLTDIHSAGSASGPLTGTYQPDGRNVLPASSLDTSPRSTNLSSTFAGSSAGDWQLFVADVSGGGSMTLNSWQLTINPVPEPSAAGLAALGLASLMLRRRRR